MFKACLKCEGTGIIRQYINHAGDYTVSHCEECTGTGKIEWKDK